MVKVALAPMISGPLSSTSEPVSQQIENYSAEMQAKTHIINGGSTFRLDGRDMVGQLNKASVSIFPERSKLVKGQEVTKEDLTSFIEENMDIFYGNEDMLTVGTWFDHDSNQTYIDVITVLDKVSDAVYLGTVYNQKAVFDLENSIEIKTGGNGDQDEEFKSSEAESFYKRRPFFNFEALLFPFNSPRTK